MNETSLSVLITTAAQVSAWPLMQPSPGSSGTTSFCRHAVSISKEKGFHCSCGTQQGCCSSGSGADLPAPPMAVLRAAHSPGLVARKCCHLLWHHQGPENCHWFLAILFQTGECALPQEMAHCASGCIFLVCLVSACKIILEDFRGHQT